MFVIRSSSQLGQQDGKPVREQTNQLSSFIDGTTVYGFTTKHKNLLLAPDKMKLRMNPHNKNGDLLPNVNDIKDKGVQDKFSTAAVFNDQGHPEFVAGDTRCLENPALGVDIHFGNITVLLNLYIFTKIVFMRFLCSLIITEYQYKYCKKPKDYPHKPLNFSK